jgi:hypothetical protein
MVDADRAHGQDGCSKFYIKRRPRKSSLTGCGAAHDWTSGQLASSLSRALFSPTSGSRELRHQCMLLSLTTGNSKQVLSLTIKKVDAGFVAGADRVACVSHAQRHRLLTTCFPALTQAMTWKGQELAHQSQDQADGHGSFRELTPAAY